MVRLPVSFTLLGPDFDLGSILKWFSQLDEIVRQLYYLISTTWGGGSRGTEIERLLYANNARNTRNVFVINGLLTIVTEYQKTQSLTGAGKLIARTPAFRVNRLLILVLGVAFWAAGFIGCYIGMEKSQCQRYFYEVFVLTGKPMDSKDFSKVLGSLNGIHLGIDLKLQDFRQLMSCLLISSTSTSFFDPSEEDPNVVAAHESFGHSLDMGRSGYGLDTTSATGLAADAVAHMQQVCLKWQAFIGMLHPLLDHKTDRELYKVRCSFLVLITLLIRCSPLPGAYDQLPLHQRPHNLSIPRSPYLYLRML